MSNRLQPGRATRMFNSKVLKPVLACAIGAAALAVGGAPAHAQVASSDEAQVGDTFATAAPTQMFGFSGRYRQVFVPSWFLGAFTKENTPLNSYHVGGEFIRRKGDLDIVVGLALQDMSPPDGNWLGAGKDPSIDTDYVQFKDFRMFALDVAFVWHTNFNEWVGMHYGAGLGLGFILGKVLRTSNDSSGCATNPGNERDCHPVIERLCPAGTGPCSEEALRARDGMLPAAGGRFKEDSIPGAIPILNVLAGFDLHIPDVPGLEWRVVEFGFYNAFFLGSTVSYLF